MPNDLTIEEKVDSAESRARQQTLERHHYDLNQPFFPSGFSVTKRNPGHWDIFARSCPGRVTAFLAAFPGSSTSAKDGDVERAFRIRGEPGNILVYDERWNPHRERGGGPMQFRSVTGAMLWVVEELMQEPPPK